MKMWTCCSCKRQNEVFFFPAFCFCGTPRPAEHRAEIREAAIRHTVMMLGERWLGERHVMLDHKQFGPWLRALGDDTEAQAIIDEARRRAA